jgi:hypothetical protein
LKVGNTRSVEGRPLRECGMSASEGVLKLVNRVFKVGQRGCVEGET